MALIDRYCPAWDLRQVNRVAVRADVREAYRALSEFDIYRVGFARRLFALRMLPERLVARVRRAPVPFTPTARIADITRDAAGFRVLCDAPGEGVVVGAVGPVWRTRIPFDRVAPEAFAAFAEPGRAKVVWSIEVAPRADGGSWLTFELRVALTDAEARARFAPYWLLIGRFSHAIRRAALRLFVSELGAAPPDDTRTLGGDGWLPGARVQRTHAVTIEAPPAALWPWLAQIGAQRAGWYSFDRLDNAGIPSATRIVPEFQALAVGDLIAARPNGGGSFAVLALVPERLLVLGSPSLLGAGPKPEGPEPYRMSWAFALEPIGTSATHLVVRVRADLEQTWSKDMLAALMLSLHEVMEREQLHNLKARAEHTVSAAA